MTRKIMIIAHSVSMINMRFAAEFAQAMVDATDDVEFEIDDGHHRMIFDDPCAEITHMISEPRFRDVMAERYRTPFGHRPRDQYRNKGRRT